MAKHWRIHSHDPARISALERAARVPAVVAQLLLCRGLDDPATARDFLDVKLSNLRDPSELPDADVAADRIYRAVAERERITVYGDYDVDGMTATAIMTRCLEMLGAGVGYYVPNRMDEGYGLNDEALSRLAEQGTKLVVTVDCGVASVSEAEHAKRLGLDLVVTDHHQFGEQLPDAAAIVHPGRPDHSYPFAGLSGAGVALKVAWAVCQRASEAKKVGPRMREFLLTAVGWAALGTVADVVPLVDENRVLVQCGLKYLRERPGLGLGTLLRVTELDKKPQLDSEDLSFTIAPRLNAAGRLGQAQLAIELLTTDSTERAVALAEYINELNGTRQTLERSVYLAASAQAQEQMADSDPAALVLADRGWHPGVIGIVAGRLAEKHHRPVVMVAFDELGLKPGIGSARSVPGFALHEALSACSRHLVSCGGHAAAAGLKIEPAELEAFRGAFREYAESEIAEADRVADIWIDAEVPLSQLTLASVGQIERLAPFGQSNPRPLLCTGEVTLAEPPRRIGGGGRHLSLRLAQHNVSMRAVAFGGGDWADELSRIDGPLSVAFRPFINTFRGRRSVELQLADWRRDG